MRLRVLAPTFLALSALLVPTLAFAEEEHHEHEHEAKPEHESPKNIVFADLGLHVIGLGYQRTVGKHIAVSISGGLYDPWTVTDKLGDIRGGMVRLRPYFFLTDNAPRGVWISPFAQGAVVRATRNGEEQTGGGFALGAAAGYAFLFGDVVHLSLGLGGQLHLAKVGGDAPPSFYTAGVHVDGTLGFAF